MNSHKPIQWHGCYDQGWHGVIVPEAFAHPAKFSKGLIGRIYAHGLAAGWWRKGDVIGDPFGGVALGGIMAAYAGLGWVGVELEAKFIGLGNANIDLHARRFKAMGAPRPLLLQGDSRRFAEIVGACAAVVTSPPYNPNDKSDSTTAQRDPRAERMTGSFRTSAAYGDTPGQIGRLPDVGGLDAVLTSPPYAESNQDYKRGWGYIDPSKAVHARRGKQHEDGTYGEAEGNIANLPTGSLDGVVTSPPFLTSRSDTTSSGGGIQAHGYDGPRGNERVNDRTYLGGADDVRHPSNIETLPAGSVDAVVTSPPWEDQESAMNAGKFKDPSAFAQAMTSKDGTGTRNATTQASREAQFNRATQTSYGNADGQLGNVTGETYWQAMAQVYGQCRLALRPGGVMAVVVKDYVKARARVPLCDQTLALLVSLGFTPMARIHAMLVKEQSEAQLIGADIVTRTERKSFFRRLAEKKGSPRIDWEEVIVVRSPH